MNDFFKGEDFTQVIGIVAGILTATSLLPQMIKTFREKKANDISLVMLLVLLGGIGCWIYYGFLRKDLPIIFTNSFSFILNIIMIVMQAKYKKGNKK
ncbi:MAG: SemiSWEET transporter [Chitinophagaceae bacterium]|nr:SemiSWEET transporter [Chitinophagaceae bacterium]